LDTTCHLGAYLPRDGRPDGLPGIWTGRQAGRHCWPVTRRPSYSS